MAAIFQKFKKTVAALRFNEVKVTSRNDFIRPLFALEIEKDSKSDQRTHLRDYSWILDLSFNPEIANTTYMGLYQLF